jgi:hypothetical protein
MSYESIDQLQSALAQQVFHYAKDSKKAAGRALGTLIELISFYLLKDWGVENSIRIEKALFEYKNTAISHNVEYTLHPVLNSWEVLIHAESPITSTKVMNELISKGMISRDEFQKVNATLITRDMILKNSCVIGRKQDVSLVAVLVETTGSSHQIRVNAQFEAPYVMVECKRVGVEEGMKKGPQTIEKAKQGAYVARSVSSLQKVRNFNGELYGILPIDDATFRFERYDLLLEEILKTETREVFTDFILSVGIVSNHGNWFSAQNMNKELQVLADAYDWLLFLTDEGLATFISELLLSPLPEYSVISEAFLSSYTSDAQGIKKTGTNRFTKSKIGTEADLALQSYFKTNRKKIASWFNVITPAGLPISDLQDQIAALASKKWV